MYTRRRAKATSADSRNRRTSDWAWDPGQGRAGSRPGVVANPVAQPPPPDSPGITALRTDARGKSQMSFRPGYSRAHRLSRALADRGETPAVGSRLSIFRTRRASCWGPLGTPRLPRCPGLTGRPARGSANPTKTRTSKRARSRSGHPRCLFIDRFVDCLFTRRCRGTPRCG
jgi:hypothetical protein